MVLDMRNKLGCVGKCNQKMNLGASQSHLDENKMAIHSAISMKRS